MNTYTGKTILLTGASSGIGEAMAHHLKTENTTLLLTARTEKALDALADAVRQAGSQAYAYPLDLSVPGAAQVLFDKVQADGHSVDVLVNNAGFGVVGPFVNTSAATYASLVAVNVGVLTELTALFLPDMLARGTGGILNVASTAAFQPLPYFATYAATKHYVLALSEALYYECKNRGVTVTCLCPGPTRTNFGERAEMRASFFSKSGSAQKVARAGLNALLSGKRTIVTGRLNLVGTLLAPLLPTSVAAAISTKLFAPAP